MMSYLTFADHFAVRYRSSAWLYEISLVIVGSLLMAASAQLAIPLPFSPVPITGQTFAVLLIGAAYGSRRGALAMIAYLLEGACGLPFFAEGTGGTLILFGPTGGYLLGFVLAAFVVGVLAERGWDRGFYSTIGAMIVGNALIFFVGLAWLSRFVPLNQVLPLGFYPFLIGGAIKTLAAALLLPTAWKLLRKF